LLGIALGNGISREVAEAMQLALAWQMRFAQQV